MSLESPKARKAAAAADISLIYFFIFLGNFCKINQFIPI
jgi:hypothetical protein